MSKQIDYYGLSTLDASSFTKSLDDTVKRLDMSLKEHDGSLMMFSYFVFTDKVVSDFLLLLCKLPVFSKEFEEMLKDRVETLQILKKLKYFVNIKVGEVLYLLTKLVLVSENEDDDSIDIAKYFMKTGKDDTLKNLLDHKFKDAIKKKLLFIHDPAMTQKYLDAFADLETAEPHAVYPTSIYRQSDGCTVATQDCQKIEAVMSTTLTTSIRIASHVLAFNSNLLAEIYRPLGRVVIVVDDKLSDPALTLGKVNPDSNKRLITEASGNDVNAVDMTISEQIQRYFDHHDVTVTMISKSGNEVDKDIESVQQILVDLKKIGVMRHEPVLVAGGGVIADIAGFACALFHRNTPYVMLATSIVAGIDAGPSPRTCCDGQGYKNAFGAFHPPVVTLTDRTLWQTMHGGMVRHGIAEIVKMACVENRELFELLEQVGPGLLVRTKFGTDFSAIEGVENFNRAEFDASCERIVGLAMESYVRAEYGNLWETHQCRPHAFGHTWSPGYELPAGMLHGHAVATCMGFGSFLSWKHCGWIQKETFERICKLINGLELSLWHDVMEDKHIFHASTMKMIQKRGGNLAAPIPKGDIGLVGYLNDITDDELSMYVSEYKQLVTSSMGLARDGYGVEVHLSDVGLGDTKDEATAFVRLEKYDEEEEKKESGDGPAASDSYNDWIKSVQTNRNAEWKFNVSFEPAANSDKPPTFPHNVLFHNTVEQYAMKNTTVASKNVQVAASITLEEELFAPCMVGTLESQFLKMQAKQMKAKKILDVGTFTGMSAIAFAEGQTAAKLPVDVDTMEFDAKTAAAARKIFSNCSDDVKNGVRLHEGSAADFMTKWAQDPNGPVFDIIFIDADKENYPVYYQLAMGSDTQRPLLAEDGMILADNSLCALLYDDGDERRQKLHEFNQMVKNDDRVEQVVLTAREGVTMISRC